MKKIAMVSMLVLLLVASTVFVAAGNQVQANAKEHTQEHVQEHTQAQTQFLLCWRTHTQDQSRAKDQMQQQQQNSE